MRIGYIALPYIRIYLIFVDFNSPAHDHDKFLIKYCFKHTDTSHTILFYCILRLGAITDLPKKHPAEQMPCGRDSQVLS